MMCFTRSKNVYKHIALLSGNDIDYRLQSLPPLPEFVLDEDSMQYAPMFADLSLAFGIIVVSNGSGNSAPGEDDKKSSVRINE
jgi:hypothetical protein